MANHMLMMSFDNNNYVNLFKSINKFLKYTVNLVDKKTINFCYIGTAGKDSWIEATFFNSCARFCSDKEVNTIKLNLTTNITQKEIFDIVVKQDILFIGGGNTKYMLDRWQVTGFINILNSLRKRDRLPVLAGVSAGGMYPFSGGLSDYIPEYYTPLQCLGWFKESFCAHTNLLKKAICSFDVSKKLNRLDAFAEAISLGILNPGYAVPNNCMLHFYNDELQNCLSNGSEDRCLFVDKETVHILDTYKL